MIKDAKEKSEKYEKSEKSERVNQEDILKEIEVERICAEALCPLPIASQRRIIVWLSDVFYGAQMETLNDLTDAYESLKKRIEKSRCMIDELRKD